MSCSVRAYTSHDLAKMTEIWNQIVLAGNAFPQENPLTLKEAESFFGEQSYCGVAVSKQSGEVSGLYILHPNNVGRCGHICNASYAVSETARGQGVGEALVRDCLCQAKDLGFRILQFNAVVKTNTPARHLYEKLGFVPLGEIPGGFQMPDGSFETIIPYYYALTD